MYECESICFNFYMDVCEKNNVDIIRGTREIFAYTTAFTTQ